MWPGDDHRPPLLGSAGTDVDHRPRRIPGGEVMNIPGWVLVTLAVVFVAVITLAILTT